MARHHNIPEFVHVKGKLIPLRLNPKKAKEYKVGEIDAFVNTFLKQVESHWVYTTMGQVGVDADHSKSSHKTLNAHKQFREDVHRHARMTDISNSSVAIAEAKRMQGTQDMIEREKYRRRYRDLSTVARERGRELKPEEADR